VNDPRPPYRQLTSGSVGSAPTATLTAARAAVHEGTRELDDARRRLRRSWQGLGATGATRCFERRSAELSAADAELGAAVDLLSSLAAEQERVKRAATPLIRWWCRAYVLLFFTDKVLLELISAQVCTALSQLRVTHLAELQRIATGFDRLAGGAECAAPLVVSAGALPPAGTSPQAIASWWKALTPAYRDALQAQHPDELAELHGLPPTVLDSVNRTRVSRDQRNAQARLDATDEGLRAHGLAGVSDAELLGNRDPEIRRLARTHAEAQGLLERTHQADAAVRSAQATAALAPPIGPVLLVDYRNTGAGGLAIAFGDPSKAHDVAVAVPGTGAGPGQPGLEQASALRREMDRKRPTGTHSTVQWIDYDAPDSLGDTRVADPRLAKEGAARLVDDVAGWRAASAGGQHVTVIGHSYGSTLVGIAGQHGLAADDIAVVGSPGVGASSADGLSPGHGHVWAGGAEHDPVVQVTQGSWFSADGSGVGPYDRSFGALQFDATNPLALAAGHTEYYAEGSPSLRNLAAISTGDYSEVTAADPGNSPVAGPVQQLGEAGQDALRGGAQTAVDLVTGHPADAVHRASNTAYELAADATDLVVNRLGGGLELGHDAAKKLLDVLF
jgi:Alpha/beta hydrolase